jgi:hypothetical protein
VVNVADSADVNVGFFALECAFSHVSWRRLCVGGLGKSDF